MPQNAKQTLHFLIGNVARLSTNSSLYLLGNAEELGNAQTVCREFNKLENVSDGLWYRKFCMKIQIPENQGNIPLPNQYESLALRLAEVLPTQTNIVRLVELERNLNGKNYTGSFLVLINATAQQFTYYPVMTLLLSFRMQLAEHLTNQTEIDSRLKFLGFKHEQRPSQVKSGYFCQEHIEGDGSEECPDCEQQTWLQLEVITEAAIMEDCKLKTLELGEFQLEIALNGQQAQRMTLNLNILHTWLIGEFIINVYYDPMFHDIQSPVQFQRRRFLIHFTNGLAGLNNLNEEMRAIDTVSDEYFDYLVPKLNDDGSYQAREDPQQLSDIWGTDLEDETREDSEISPKSAITYCQLRQQKFNMVQRWRVLGRLSREYHEREKKIFDHLDSWPEASWSDSTRENELVKELAKGSQIGDQKYKEVIREAAGALVDVPITIDNLLNLLRESAGIIRGRMEALPLSERWDTNRWRAHLDVGVVWFTFLMAVSHQIANVPTHPNFNFVNDAQVQGPIPAFYTWLDPPPGST